MAPNTTPIDQLDAVEEVVIVGAEGLYLSIGTDVGAYTPTLVAYIFLAETSADIDTVVSDKNV